MTENKHGKREDADINCLNFHTVILIVAGIDNLF